LTIQVLLAAAVCWLLARRVGAWPTVAYFSAAMGVLCMVGALLLRSAPLGRIAWQNRVAGLVLPWGYRISGKLPAITAVSWAVWTLIAVGVAVAMGAATRTASAGASRVWPTMMIAGWAINAAAAFYLLGLYARYREHAPRGRKPTLLLVGVLCALIAVSFLLSRAGRPVLAAIVSIGPASVVGAIFGVFALVLTTVGRKVNWH
jgi:hypothetical protein